MKAWCPNTVRLFVYSVGQSLGILSYVLLATPGFAQITPDNSLGEERSIVTPGAVLNGIPTDLIEGGAVRGTNLFHSLTHFNINTGQRVYFANPVGVENILSRITGGEISTIDGLLGVDGAANLFLLNPNGVIFGPNAQLDISGSFTTSTADRFAFADGSQFSTVPTQNDLLSVSVPLGVQFNGTPQGDINSTGQLSVGQSLTLAGHDLYLEGGKLTAGADLTLQAQGTVTIRDTAADAFLAQSEGNLTIQGNDGIDIWTLQHLEETPFVSAGNLYLISDGTISGDAHFESGGNLQLLTLAGDPGNFLSYYDPIIFADGDVIFGDYVGVALKVEATGTIQAGNITITGPDTAFSADGSGSDEDLLASSRAAILRAGVDSVSGNIPQTTGGTIFEPGGGVGQPAGSIIVESINTSGTTDDGGPIILAADGDIIINGFLNSSTYSVYDNAGSGGVISITSTSGDVITQELDSSSYSYYGDAGSGGKISISAASGTVTTQRIDSSAYAYYGAVGSGGAISISTASGDIATENVISSAYSYFGDTGAGGDISIASTAGRIDTGSLVSSAYSYDGTVGKGGRVAISSTSGEITLESVDSSSYSFVGTTGAGGDVSISSASGDIGLTGSLAANTYSRSGTAGPGGNILISSGAGNVTTQSLDASSRSTYGNSGPGGNITVLSTSGDITTNDIVNSSSFVTSLSGEGNSGGDISISSASGEITLNEEINSSAFQGTGGDIEISALSGSILGDISSSGYGQGGAGGSISISLGSGTISSSLNSGTASDSTDIGAGGDITILSEQGTIELSQVTSGSASNSGDVGIGGTVSISSGSGNIAIASLDSGSASDNGAATSGGAVTISSISGQINIGSLETNSFSLLGGDANAGGEIVISSESGDIIATTLNSSSSSSAGYGNSGPGGTVSVSSTSGEILLDVINSASFSFYGSSGAGGAISISSESGNISSQRLDSFSVALYGNAGLGGDVDITSVSGNIDLNSGVNTLSGAVLGNAAGGGNISLKTLNGTLSGLNLISAAVTADGIAGSGGTVTLEAANPIDSTAAIAAVSSSGNSGNLIINGTGDLTLTDLVIDTNNLTNSIEVVNPFTDEVILLLDDSPLPSGALSLLGDVDISAAGRLTLTNSELISRTSTNNSASSFTLSSQGQTIINDSRVSSNSTGSGATGSILVNAEGGLALQGTSSFATVANGTGRGSGITLNTPQLALGADTTVETITAGSGTGGQIAINTPDLLTIQGAGTVVAATQGPGIGGGLTIDAAQVSIDQTTLSAETSGSGAGGDAVLAANQLTFANGGQIAATTSAAGTGGDVILATSQPLTLIGNGQLLVSAEGADSGPAGNLAVTAPFLNLQDGVTLKAMTASLQGGGNIVLDIDDTIVLSNGTFINAESLNPNALEGANIVIGTNFLIALLEQNNDILANALSENGGRVEINTANVFGFTQQSGFTTAELRANQTNDLSGSSTLAIGGEDAGSPPIVNNDPPALPELSSDLIDLSGQLAAQCVVDDEIAYTQFATADPTQGIANQSDQQGMEMNASDRTGGEVEALPAIAPTEIESKGSLVEAESLVIDANGNVALVSSSEVTVTAILEFMKGCTTSPLFR